MLFALAERLNPAAWTDADQITAGLQQAAEALQRLSHVFAKRRRRSRSGPARPGLHLLPLHSLHLLNPLNPLHSLNPLNPNPLSPLNPLNPWSRDVVARGLAAPRRGAGAVGAGSLRAPLHRRRGDDGTGICADRGRRRVVRRVERVRRSCS